MSCLKMGHISHRVPRKFSLCYKHILNIKLLNIEKKFFKLRLSSRNQIYLWFWSFHFMLVLKSQFLSGANNKILSTNKAILGQTSVKVQGNTDLWTNDLHNRSMQNQSPSLWECVLFYVNFFCLKILA